MGKTGVAKTMPELFNCYCVAGGCFLKKTSVQEWTDSFWKPGAGFHVAKMLPEKQADITNAGPSCTSSIGKTGVAKLMPGIFNR